jgi:hypothetical protein
VVGVFTLIIALLLILGHICGYGYTASDPTPSKINVFLTIFNEMKREGEVDYQNIRVLVTVLTPSFIFCSLIL